MNMKPQKTPPTQQELDTLYDKIVTHNLQRVKMNGSNAGPGPFAKVAANNECTVMAIRRMLKGKNKRWKSKHHAIYNELLKNVKSIK